MDESKQEAEEQFSALNDKNNVTRKKRGRQNGNESQRTSQRPHKRIRTFTYEERWSLTELTRLIEALKRYDPHNLSGITSMIKTKSKEQVHDKIESVRQLDMSGKSNRVKGFGMEQAPIETWIDLVQELTNYEPADYSQFVPKVLGLITRNEKFADSGYPNLKWRNIYQFLSDMAAGRVEVHELSDLESLVVLDMMHSLGSSLHTADTSEQRCILDFKYNLLNFKSQNPNRSERELINQRVAQALSNDFWEPEDMPGNTPATPGSSQTCETSQSGMNLLHLPMLNETWHTENHETLPTSFGGQNVITDAVSGGRLHEEAVSLSKNTILPQPSGCDSTRNRNQPGESNAYYGQGLNKSSPNGVNFVRSTFFTLNPLCVPTQLLYLQPKKGQTSEEEQTN